MLQAPCSVLICCMEREAVLSAKLCFLILLFVFFNVIYSETFAVPVIFTLFVSACMCVCVCVRVDACPVKHLNLSQKHTTRTLEAVSHSKISHFPPRMVADVAHVFGVTNESMSVGKHFGVCTAECVMSGKECVEPRTSRSEASDWIRLSWWIVLCHACLSVSRHECCVLQLT